MVYIRISAKFIDKMPRIESHYIRQYPVREYIDGAKTIADLFKDTRKIKQLIDIACFRKYQHRDKDHLKLHVIYVCKNSNLWTQSIASEINDKNKVFIFNLQSLRRNTSRFDYKLKLNSYNFIITI